MINNKIKIINVKQFSLEIKKTKNTLFDIILKINNKTSKENFGNIASFIFHFDPQEFLKSIEVLKKRKKENRYYIFTCGCGEPGCDGWDNGIYVYIESENIIWLMDEEEKMKKPIKLIFNIEQYKKVHKDLLNGLNDLYSKEGNMNIERGFYPSLKEILSDYKYLKYHKYKRKIINIQTQLQILKRKIIK